MQRSVFLSLLLIFAAFSDAAAEVNLESRLLPAPELKWKSDSGWYGKTRGRLEFDAVHSKNDQANHHGGMYDRRTRLGADIGYGDTWEAIFEVDFASDDPIYTDVVVRYHNRRNLYVDVGHFKEAFGMERIQSSKQVLFNERAAIDTFVPQRNLGVQATQYHENTSLTLGMFTDSMVTNANKDRFALTGRGTAAFAVADGMLHTALSGSWRRMEQVKFSASPPASNINLASTGKIYDVDVLTQGGLETAFGRRNILVSGEYIVNHLERETAKNALLDGWYVQAAWMLTGEHYTYSTAKDATFQPVKPARPFSLAQGTWGAVEFGARYQAFSLNGGSVQVGSMQAVTGGVNWYPNTNWRVSGDVTYFDSDAKSITPHDNPIVSSLRVRVGF